jgi:hypothetical protein
MIHRPRSALAAAAVAALLALSGCGGGSDDDASSSAADPSATTSSPSAPSSSSAGTEGATKSLGDVIAKSVDEGKSAHVTIDMGGNGSGEGDVGFDGDASVMQLNLDMSGRKTEMRLVDGTVYMKVPGQSGKFLKMDVGGAASKLGVDPSEALTQLEKSGADAEDLGDGNWRISKDGATTDLYVGDDGYLERIEVKAASGGTVTMTYSDWGKKVEVKAPPASDVMRMPGS